MQFVQKLSLVPLLLLLLSACTVGVVSQPVSEPAIAVPPQPNGSVTGGEKVVELATQTLTPAGGPTATVAADAAATSTPTPANLPNTEGGSTNSEDSATSAWPTAIVFSGVQMVTYTDTISGFSFQYPGFWNITDLPNELKKDATAYTISLRSPGPTPGPKQMDGIPPGMAAIDITLIRGGAKTLTQAADERRQASLDTPSGQPLKILKDETVSLPDGLTAQYFIYQDVDGSTTSQLVTLIHEHTLLVSGFGDQTLFATVVGSIQEK